jgi:hypothetical protein
LDNTTDFSDDQTDIGDVGFVYKVPTARGSLVVGGGYSQTTDFNRAFSASGFNDFSTITDLYAYLPRTDSVNTVAYNVYAIEDVNADSSVSILRFGLPFSAFPGINQDIEVIEEGRLGEYSAFFATELLKNFSVGISIGYLTGTYSYRREFLESDRRGNYDGQFIDSDGDGDFDTDIDDIYSINTVTAELEAFSARLGLVYQPIANLDLGLSYEFPARFRINELYNFQMTTTFDNGIQYSAESPGRFIYNIVRPQRVKAGFTFEADEGLILSASAEAVPYSQGRIEFDEIELNVLENNINSTVESNLSDVINLRGGLAFKVNERFTPRIGYAYFPSPQDEAGSARQFISGGFSAELTEGLVLDFGLQYSFWEDQNVLYSTPRVFEVVQEDVRRIQAMVGIKMAL